MALLTVAAMTLSLSMGQTDYGSMAPSAPQIAVASDALVSAEPEIDGENSTLPAESTERPAVTATAPIARPPSLDISDPQTSEPAVPAQLEQSQPDDIVVSARPPGDPLRAVNTQSFAATQAVDQAITGPAALAYKRVVPDPVRDGLRNFLNNLHEPTVALNYLLQLKPGKAAETLGRFAINSTIGAVGLFDLAKRQPFRLPRRRNGFANTLGYYGVKPGAFIFLPLVGPTTVRDFTGGVVDRLLTASFLRGPFRGRPYLITTGVVRVLDRRAERDEQLRTVRDSADPYEARRKLYMRTRQDEIDGLRGRRRGGGPASSDAAAPSIEEKAPVVDPVVLPPQPISDQPAISRPSDTPPQVAPVQQDGSASPSISPSG